MDINRLEKHRILDDLLRIDIISIITKNSAITLQQKRQAQHNPNNNIILTSKTVTKIR